MLASKLLGLPPYTAISAILLAALTIAALYLARSTVHQAIRAISYGLHGALRLGATSASQAEVRLANRNREVLLAAGREAKERAIEKEFERINGTVHKDLANFPTMNRGLNEVIRRIEEDHQQAIEVPPDPPAWVKAVEAVAKIDSRQGIGAGNVLGAGQRFGQVDLQRVYTLVGRNEARTDIDRRDEHEESLLLEEVPEHCGCGCQHIHLREVRREIQQHGTDNKLRPREQHDQ